MKYTKIVDLGQIRGLLAEWEKVRQAVLAGKIKSFYTQLQGEDGREAVYCGGVYKADPRAAMKAILKVSAARALMEDDPPQFQSSRF